MNIHMKDIVCLVTFWMLWVSCSENVIPEESVQGNNTLSLNLYSSYIESRTEQGVDELNENVLNSLDCFFYKASANKETTPAVCYRSFTNLNSQREHVLNISFTDEEIETLFGTNPATGSTCKVYVIANRPSELTWAEEKTSVGDLKALVITSDSFKDDIAESNFVMDSTGDDKVELTKTQTSQTLSGSVSLYRAAAKISFVITEVVDVEEKDSKGNIVKWTANPENMIVKFHQGVKKGTLDTSIQPYVLTEDDYYDLDESDPERKLVNIEGGTGHELPLPYYSYASDWSQDATHEAYFTLIVPWKKTGEDNYQSCYYQIPVNAKTCNLVRNNHYKINLKVGRLGSFVEETPVELPVHNYVIIDWTTQDVDVDIKVPYFLAVENSHVVLNNINEVRIPYVTSHDAEIVDVTCTKTNLINGNEVEVKTDYILNLDNNGNIYYKRDLINNFLDEDFDLSPYTIQFKLQHKAETGLFQWVTIVQYPAISAQIYENWDYRNNYNNKTGENGNNGFVFVNGYQGSSVNGKQDFFCSANGMRNAYDGASPNMYVFTVSSVQGTNYVIGDPRENTVSSIVDETHTVYSKEYSIWYSAPTITDGVVSNSNRILEYYYETDDTDRTLNMIAPQFRVASAYAVLSTSAAEAKNLDYLKKRCASYQEDGYPAGRWRLPTKGEFEFIFSLVNRERLPQMYEVGSSYWCAHGLGTPERDGSVNLNRVTTSSGNSVRCVYDEWYWKDKLETPQQKNVFTWGDKQR